MDKKDRINNIKLFVLKHKKRFSIGLVAAIVLLVLVIPGRSPEILQESNQYKIENICDYATLRAVYHNVGSSSRPEEEGLFSFTKYGYKKYWIEYDGYVDLGVDAKKVKIDGPNIFGEIKVFVPKAEVLGTPDYYLDSMDKAVTDTGAFTSIKDEDKTAALDSAHKTMLENAKSDVRLLDQAQKRAGELIMQYIINAGKSFNKDYKVKLIYEE